MPTLRVDVKPASSVAFGVAVGDHRCFFACATEIDGQVRGILRHVREMRVHVDEAGQAGVIAKLKERQRTGMLQRALHARDTPIANDHGHIVQRLGGDAIDERAAMNREAAAVGLERRRGKRDGGRCVGEMDIRLYAAAECHRQ